MPDKLIHVLGHQYREANLSLHLLKGQDLRQTPCLQQACAKTRTSLFLATIEKMKNRATSEDENDDVARGHHYIDDVLESSLELKALFNTVGNLLRQVVSIEYEDFLGEPFSGQDPYEEDYEGYQGNSGCTAKQWYRKAICLCL